MSTLNEDKTELEERIKSMIKDKNELNEKVETLEGELSSAQAITEAAEKSSQVRFLFTNRIFYIVV